MSEDGGWLHDILGQIPLLLSATVAGPSALDDVMTEAAVLRWLEVIGEAAGHVSAQLRAAHPEVPWADMVGMRNILIHAYRQVEPEHVWRAVERLPELERQIHVILEELSE